MKSSFNTIIKSGTPVLVDFHADWCGPCKVLAPILKQVKEALGDAIKIVKIDVDKNKALSSQLNIMGVPTFILYKKGEQIWRESGMQSARKLEEVIENAL